MILSDVGFQKRISSTRLADDDAVLDQEQIFSRNAFTLGSSRRSYLRDLSAHLASELYMIAD